jgi:hypothetical protein
MRRTLPTAVLALALALLVPKGAQAIELAKRFGVGYQVTLAGAHGLSARYQASQSIGLELIGGFDAAWFDDDETGKFDAIFVAGGFSFVLVSDDRGLLSLGTRVSVGTSFDRTTGPRRDGEPHSRVTDIAFEVPLSIEYFVTPHFALRTGVGLVFAIVHDEAPVLGESDDLNRSERVGGSSVSFGTGEVLAAAGFTVWF